MKTQTLALLAILMASCSARATSPVISATKLVSTKTLVPTSSYTAVFTPTPIITAAPTTAQRTPAAAETASVSPASNSIVFTAYLTGITETGEIIYSSSGDGGIFKNLYLSPEGIAALRFSIHQDGPYTQEFTSTPTRIPTTAWRVLVYRYRADGKYSNQPVVETDLSKDVPIEELQANSEDCRAFTYQVLDGQETLIWQGYFSFSPDTILVRINTEHAVQEGVIIGYPYSLNEKEAAFFHEGRFIAVHEPQGGFYRLFYAFSFLLATGTASTSSLEAIASELTIRLFVYREGGQYSLSHSLPLTGKLVGGVYTVDLPIDYLRENVNANNRYYLQMVDGKGAAIKEEYIVFIPYTR